MTSHDTYLSLAQEAHDTAYCAGECGLTFYRDDLDDNDRCEPCALDYADEVEDTTPTGIPITTCDTCGHTHPVTRVHCRDCGRAHLFGDCGGGAA